jgi:invasion protein IalB
MTPISIPLCRHALAVAAAALLLALLPAGVQRPYLTPALGQAPETLPGGASSVQETYGSWIVSCRIVDSRKACTLSQVQRNQQTGQRSFAVELKPPRDGKTDGLLVMPFGLALSAGVKLTLDDKPLGPTPTPFSTCVPDGCLVPVSFPTAATDSIKKAKTLTVSANPLGQGDPLTIAVALDGFAPALARTSDLAK